MVVKHLWKKYSKISDGFTKKQIGAPIKVEYEWADWVKYSETITYDKWSGLLQYPNKVSDYPSNLKRGYYINLSNRSYSEIIGFFNARSERDTGVEYINIEITPYPFRKDVFIGEIKDENRNAYPDNGVLGNYFYEYIGLDNQPPTISGDSSNLGIITEDTKIRFSIDDADGDVVTCEIKIDGVKTKDSPFISELNQTYSIPIILKDHTIGEHTVEVIATDSKGASSNKIWYFERGNSNPTISGRDEDLGDKNVGFDVPFSVDDIDVEDILTVTVTLNNKVIQTINNALRQKEYNTKISDGDVYAQEIGKLNTITIKVDDGKGGVSYRYKYFKRTNTAPIISGNDENLGTISVEPTIKFSAYDLEDDAMTYSIFLNDTALVRDKVLEANKEIIFEVPRNEFAKLINGNISNRLRVVVQDIQKASSVRNYTFKRELKECYHKTTHETDIQATEYFAYVNTLLAEGAKLKVSLTNNAFDKTPTWEDATETISEGRTYKFTNKNQTSNKAGVAIKIEIISENSTGASWILGYGGGFK